MPASGSARSIRGTPRRSSGTCPLPTRASSTSSSRVTPSALNGPTWNPGCTRSSIQRLMSGGMILRPCNPCVNWRSRPATAVMERAPSTSRSIFSPSRTALAPEAPGVTNQVDGDHSGHHRTKNARIGHRAERSGLRRQYCPDHGDYQGGSGTLRRISSTNAANTLSIWNPTWSDCATTGTIQELVNELFRIIHTIKSNARIFKLERIAGEAHGLEPSSAKSAKVTGS